MYCNHTKMLFDFLCIELKTPHINGFPYKIDGVYKNNYTYYLGRDEHYDHEWGDLYYINHRLNPDNKTIVIIENGFSGISFDITQDWNDFKSLEIFQ